MKNVDTFSMFMVSWCSFWVIYGIVGIISGLASLAIWSILIHALCMAVQLFFGWLYYKDAKESFSIFFDWAKLKLKK